MTQPGDRKPTSWLHYSHLGMQYCVTLLLVVLLGTWADERWGTGPWLTVAAAAVGMTAATYLLLRQVNSRR
jgi:F0F1-type ATP synthase assembly protein I